MPDATAPSPGTAPAARVRAAIDGLVASGDEVGFQVAVVHRGEVDGYDLRLADVWPAFGANGSAAYGDLDSGVAVAVLRNRFGGGPTALTAVDRLVVAAFPP
ncbi:MAG TPA: hypothetical protein VIL36_04910, partial [Acidimicrobiales bacterium]